MADRPLSIDVRHRLMLKSDDLSLLTREDGEIVEAVPGFGLFYRDTCYLASYALRLHGTEPLSLMSSAREGIAAQLTLTNHALDTANGTTIPDHTLTLRRTFLVLDDDGPVWTDTIELTNYGQQPICLPLSLSLCTRFESMFRLRWALVQRGEASGVMCCAMPPRGGYCRLMPFKHHAARRHHIPKAVYRTRNWPAYEAGLKRRGDLTLWIEETALAGWRAERRTTPGGQRHYSDLAITLMLTLRLVFRLALRQAEGFAASVLRLLHLDLPVPDHTTLSRRGRKFADRTPGVAAGEARHIVIDSTGLQVFGYGAWHGEKYGHNRRSWRTLHIALDAGTGEILASTLTDNDADDAGEVPHLLAQGQGPIASVTADGAYDHDAVYQAVAARQPQPPPEVVIRRVPRRLRADTKRSATLTSG